MKKELIVFRDSKSPISEIFRTLRTNIQFMNTKKNSKTILITSTYSDEGKTWISANLAVTFAQAGKKVLLIDADMRKGRQYEIFRVAPKPGLSNYLSGVKLNDDDTVSENILDYIQQTEIDKLYVLSSGNIPPNPSELLISAQMVHMLGEVKELFDVIIVDGTPIQLVADSLILARMVDSTIIVTACEETKKEDLKRVITNIKNVGGKISGIILNKVPVSSKKYAQKYYYSSNSSNKSTKSHAKDMLDSYTIRSMETIPEEAPREMKENLHSYDEIKIEPEIYKNINKGIGTHVDIKKDYNAYMPHEHIKKDYNVDVSPEYIKKDYDNLDVSLEQTKKEPEVYIPHEHTKKDVDKNVDNEINIDRATQRTNDILKQINDYLNNEKK